MKQSLVVLSIIFASTCVLLANEQNGQTRTGGANDVTQQDKKDWDDLKKGFKEHWDLMSGSIWSLIHASESPTEVKQSMELFESIYLTIGSDDPASLKKFNGPAGFKSQLLKLLRSEDDTIAGFAAHILALTGDQTYAPQIALLLEKKDPATTGEYRRQVSIRGSAARALGLMGATKYTGRIVPLLGSENPYDRSGAAMALGYLKATEHAKDVVELLLRKDLSPYDDTSPIQSLIQMGVAASYKKEIAEGLTGLPGERMKAAMYTLAHLRAREFSPNIAKVLRLKYGKGDAAKALALMGAKEYAAEIARLLNDESSLAQKDAALALGILGAKEYAPAVARLLRAKEDFVRYYAAVALVLVDAKRYAKTVIPLIDETHHSGAYLNSGDLHPLVELEFREIDRRFKREFARMKAETK